MSYDLILNTNNDSLREKKTIKVKFNDKDINLYVRNLNVSISLRLSKLLNELEEIQKSDLSDVKKSELVILKFFEILELTIENFNDENVKNFIYSIDATSEIFEKLIVLIQEKLTINTSAINNIENKKKRRNLNPRNHEIRTRRIY